MDPPEVRNRGKQEKASAKTHQSMQVLLAALSAGPMTPAAVDDHVKRIYKASAPLTKSDPAKAAKVFMLCLQMQVDQLPPDQLKQLRQRIDASADHPLLRGLRREIDVAPLRGDPLMAGILNHFDRAFQASLSGDRDTAEDQLGQAHGKATMLLQQHQRVKDGEDAFVLGKELLKEAFALWVQRRAPADKTQLVRFLQTVPSAIQSSWRDAGPQHLPAALNTVDQMLNDAIQQTEKAFSHALQTACTAALANPTPETLCAVADTWTALKNHCEAFDRPPGDAQEVVPALAAVIQRAAESPNLQDLGPDALTHQQLHGLGRALETLGIPHDGHAIAHEIARRKQDSAQPYMQALGQVLADLAKDDLPSALASLREANAHFGRLLPVHQALGGRAQDVNDQTVLADNLFEQACLAINPQTREQAFKVINGTQGLLLTQVLMGMGLRARGDEDLSAIGQVGTSLQRLKGHLAVQLHQEREMGELSPDETRGAAGLLDDATFDIAHRFTDGLVQRPME